MTFESLTLTPFCIEILGVKNGYFNVFSGVFSAIFGWNRVKCARISPLSLFLLFFADIPCFFPGRDQLLGRAGQENIGPRISPLHEFWIAGLDSST